MWRLATILLFVGLPAAAEKFTMSNLTLNCELTKKVSSPHYNDFTAKVKIGDPVRFDIEFGLYEKSNVGGKSLRFRSRIKSDIWLYTDYFGAFNETYDGWGGGKFTHSEKNSSLAYQSNRMETYTELGPGYFTLMELGYNKAATFRYRNINPNDVLSDPKYDHKWEWGDTLGNFMYGTCEPIDLRFEMFDAVHKTVIDLRKQGIDF